MPWGIVRTKCHMVGETPVRTWPCFSSETTHEQDTRLRALSFFYETKLQSQKTVTIIQVQMKQEWQNVGKCGSSLKDSWGGLAH